MLTLFTIGQRMWEGWEGEGGGGRRGGAIVPAACSLKHYRKTSNATSMRQVTSATSMLQVLEKIIFFSQNTPGFWAWPLCLHQTRDFRKTKTVISHDKRTYIVVFW